MSAAAETILLVNDGGPEPVIVTREETFDTVNDRLAVFQSM